MVLCPQRMMSDPIFLLYVTSRSMFTRKVFAGKFLHPLDPVKPPRGISDATKKCLLSRMEAR